jgi:hypothetical protein
LAELEMADPLFFFGAGASASFGIPTMKQMVPLFKEELTEKTDADTLQEVDLYRAVEDFLAKDFHRVDLEAVFSVIDGVAGGLTPKDLGYLPTFFVRRAKDPTLLDPPPDIVRNAARRLLGKFEDFIQRMCWVNRDQTGKIIETYLGLFNQIFSVMGGVVATIRYKGGNYNFSPDWEMFTTNYDNVLETFWRDGIRQVPLNTIFSHDDKSSMQVFAARRIFENNLKLVKLHGSVTWWLEDGTDTIVETEQPPSEYGAKKFTGQVLVYPIQQKDTFVPPFLDMFYALKEGLRSHQRWLVIGYSFADDMIRSLFARSSTSNTMLVLVHPDDGVAIKIRGEPGWKGQIRQILTNFGDPQTSTAIARALTG